MHTISSSKSINQIQVVGFKHFNQYQIFMVWKKNQENYKTFENI